jgi:hypothetical protein
MTPNIRNLIIIVFTAALFISGVIFGVGRGASNRSIIPTAQARDKKDGDGCKRCTQASLKGCFGYSYTGTVSGFGSIAAVGPINFDGEGNASATYSVNLAGTNFQGSFTGTYTVNDDCTGAITLNLPVLGISSNGRFVIVEKGEEAHFMGTDPGVTVTGVARKQ